MKCRNEEMNERVVARSRALAIVAWAALCFPVVSTPAEELYLDIGSMAPKPQLGFGWGRAAVADGRPYRWIKHLEADVRINIENPADTELSVRARPQYVPYTRQTVSVLINGTYAGEWVCADHATYETYSLAIPARFWVAGKNRLTFRMAYRKRVGPDQRELSLCVDTIALSTE